MIKKNQIAKVAAAISVTLAFLGGCNSKNNAVPGPTLGSDKQLVPRSEILQPEPKEKDSVQGQLSRYLGQTQFLNPHQPQRFMALAEAAPQAANAKSAGTQRAVQESDSLKIKPPEGKIIFSLNYSRGLVISSIEDVKKPAVLGHVPATGNYSTDMYYTADTSRIYVLERYYYDANDESYSQRDSRVLVYDVSSLTSPKLLKSVALTGEISDSRVLDNLAVPPGQPSQNILYVALTQWPAWFGSFESGQKATGSVVSYNLADLEKDKPESIDTVTLSMPVSARENMNIIETPNPAGGNDYYLIAILSESGYGWWDRKNSVEVVNITDTGGKIIPVMTVNAKGTINERSQTFVKNNALTVVSNYTPNTGTMPSLLKIAVETFVFPTDETKKSAISTNVANARTLMIEEKLKSVAPEKLEEAFATLVASGDNQLKGLFIKMDGKGQEGRFIKKVADFAEYQGESTGQFNAQLKDVRVAGNKLYAFWLPSSNIDPLDVYDYTDPSKGTPHIGHAEYEGWVDRGIPLSFNGKDYIIGLGWKQKTNSAGPGRAVPRVSLFPITAKKKKVNGMTVLDVNPDVDEDLTLDGDDQLYVNFNSPDKFIDIQTFTDDRGNFTGKGVILFQISSWSSKPGSQSGSGGKLIGFNLANLDAADPVFKDGELLTNKDYSWLQRTIRNPYQKLIHTASDRRLTTFASPDDGVGESKHVAEALSSLEIARDIKAFVNLGGKGVQIIDDSEGYWSSQSGQTLLRLVDKDKADTESTKVLHEEVIASPYASHLVLGDNSLVLLTSKRETLNTSTDVTKPVWVSNDTYTVTQVSVANGKLVKSNTVDWTVPAQFRNGPIFMAHRVAAPFWWGGSSVSLVQLKSGEVLVSSDSDARLLSVAPGTIGATQLDLKACAHGNTDTTILPIDGELYASYMEIVKDKDLEGLEYERNFIAKASVHGASLTCKPAINIPGKLIGILDGDKLITDDDIVVDTVQYPKINPADKPYYRFSTRNVMEALKLSEKDGSSSVALVDLYDPTGVVAEEFKRVGNSYVFIDVDRRQANNRYAEPSFAKLSVNSTSLRFEKTRPTIIRLTPETKMHDVTIAGVFPDTKNGADAYLAVILGGRKAVVVGWNDKDESPTLIQKKIGLVNPDLTLEKGDFLPVISPWSLTSGSNPDLVHFTPDQRTIELSQGLFGVVQGYIGD